MMNKLSKFCPHPLIIAIFIIAVVFYFINVAAIMDTPDAPWHIEAGKYILEHKTIPETDPFSYTAGDYSWYNMSWLWNIIIAFVEKNFGLETLHVLRVVFGAFLVCLVVHFAWKRNGITEDPIKITATLVGLTLWSYLSIRPQIMSFLFAVLTHYCVHAYASRQSKKIIYFVPLIMVLWVNMHGGFIASFTIIGAYFLGAIKDNDKEMMKKLFIVGFITGLACFINPYGVFIIEALLRTIGNVMTDYISEWRSFDFGEILGSSVFLLVFAVISNSRDKEVMMGEKILIFLWLAAGLDSIRNFIFFSLFAAPYVALQLQKCITIQEHKDIDTPRTRISMMFASLIIITLLLIPGVRHVVTFKDPVIGLSPLAPIEEIRYIEAHYADLRFFNSYDIGGYISYYSDIPVFIDGRAGTAYPDEVIVDNLEISFSLEGWEEKKAKYEFEGAILQQQLSFYDKLIEMPEWHEVYKGKMVSVFVREDKLRDDVETFIYEPPVEEEDQQQDQDNETEASESE
ncbi:MAG: hypothetical protein MK137_00180 [Rickettsiales bacterium]|nr:hypothetical protein [Rickettsiales bacterium]